MMTTELVDNVREGDDQVTSVEGMDLHSYEFQAEERGMNFLLEGQGKEMHFWRFTGGCGQGSGTSVSLPGGG